MKKSAAKDNVVSNIVSYLDNGNKIERIYRSNILKLELQQINKMFWGFNFKKIGNPMYVPDSNLDHIIIKLDGVDKNLSRKELSMYLDELLKSQNSKVIKETKNFIKNYPRLLKHN
jgi:hypothetical protein